MRGDFFYQRVGSRIVSIGQTQGISLETLSDWAHIDRTSLARIEQGKVNPSLRVLHKLTRALRVSMSFLFIGV